MNHSVASPQNQRPTGTSAASLSPVAYPQLHNYKPVPVPKDGNCLPASALLFVQNMYPDECSFEDVGQVQTLILDSIRDNSEHWRSCYDATWLDTSTSMTFDECLAFYNKHPSGLWSSRMGFFMHHVLANILKREIIVRDLSGGCDLVTKIEPYPAIDPQQLRHPVFLKFCDNHYDALLPAQVESEEPQNGIWEKVSRKSRGQNKPAQRAASVLSPHSPNTFGVLSYDPMEVSFNVHSENVCAVSNSDSGKENVAMVSPETPQRRVLTFEQPVQSDSSIIHEIKMLRILAQLLGIKVINANRDY